MPCFRVRDNVGRRLRSLRGHPILNPTAYLEINREQRGGHAADPTNDNHAEAALAWLCRAQDATPDDGFSHSYRLAGNTRRASKGWLPSYPEVTGYIIPTLYAAAALLGKRELAERAERAARWEIEIQLPSGAVMAGPLGRPVSPAIFNTGQVIFGWLSACRATGDGDFADAALRAGNFLVESLDEDGHWRRNQSPLVQPGRALYNARTAWALAEAGLLLDEPNFTDAARRALRAIAREQHPSGWLPHCCLSDHERPLLHTVAYAARGLLEGGRLLEDDHLVSRAISAAEPLLERVQENGWMAGRFAADWSPAAEWSCLTGQAQMASVWMRLAAITSDQSWLAPVPRVLHFLKTTQNRTSRNPGLRGGVKGSAPLTGEYGRLSVLSWATKFFVDALLRDELAEQRAPEVQQHLRIA